MFRKKEKGVCVWVPCWALPSGGQTDGGGGTDSCLLRAPPSVWVPSGVRHLDLRLAFLGLCSVYIYI